MLATERCFARLIRGAVSVNALFALSLDEGMTKNG
jgi:hypothetical protein